MNYCNTSLFTVVLYKKHSRPRAKEYICFRFESIVSLTSSEDSASVFKHKETCIFDTSQIKISGLIEFAICPSPNFLYPPVNVFEGVELAKSFVLQEVQLQLRIWETVAILELSQLMSISHSPYLTTEQRGG